MDEGGWEEFLGEGREEEVGVGPGLLDWFPGQVKVFGQVPLSRNDLSELALLQSQITYLGHVRHATLVQFVTQSMWIVESCKIQTHQYTLHIHHVYKSAHVQLFIMFKKIHSILLLLLYFILLLLLYLTL